MRIQLITLQEAKDQVRVTNTDSDFDLESKIEEASAVYMRHAKLFAVPEEWFVPNPASNAGVVNPPVIISAPANVKAIVKYIVADMYFNRESTAANPLPDNVKMLIDRDPTLA